MHYQLVRKMKARTIILFIFTTLSLLGSDDWKENPEKYKGRELEIEIGSLRQIETSSNKEGFLAYAIVPAFRIEIIDDKGTLDPFDDIRRVVETTYGPLEHVYISENQKAEFEEEYIAKRPDALPFGPVEPWDPDKDLRWTTPKLLSGIFWELDGKWVLVRKKAF
jgi:hypothetical protein